MVTADTGTLIVFAKRPRLGRVKTRLQPKIRALNATKIYSLLLQKTLATVERVPSVRRFIMPADRRDVAWFVMRYRIRGWGVVGQRHGDLGKRMEEALKEVGDSRLPKILIGSDITDFRADDLTEALSKIKLRNRVVLGPAVDGGYWLIGVNGRLPSMFGGIVWGSSSVLQDTLGFLGRQQIKYDLVSRRRDLDRARDLRILNGWLSRRLNRLKP